MRDLLLKRRGKFILYMIACILPIVCAISFQYMLGLMFNSIYKGELNYFIKTSIIYLAIILFGVCLSAACRLMQVSYIRDTLLEVRRKAFENIVNKTYTEFSRKSKDVYISNLTNDINTFEQQFFGNLMNIIFMITLYIVSISILLYFDYTLALGVTIMSIILFFVSKSFQKKTVELQENVSHKNENFTLESANTFNGVEILKLNNVEKTFMKKLLKSIDLVEVCKFRYFIFLQGQRGIVELLIGVFHVGILTYLLNLIFKGADVGTVIFIMNISLMCILPSGRSMPFLNELKASAKIYHKITKGLEFEENRIIRDNNFEFISSISVKGLTFNYEEKEILSNATFDIEKGKKYLLKGSSGSGKTTLIKLLSMIYDDYKGEITLDGVEYRSIQEKSFNDNVSFIYQDVFLFEDTIFNNIALFKELSEEEVLQAVEKSGLSEFINDRELGIYDKLLENGKNLSGGERQRISIARALAKKASILFVDEGTSGLNEELGKIVEDTLLSLDNTVISISHKYYEGISEKYDYVIEIKDGQLTQYSSEKYFKEVAII